MEQELDQDFQTGDSGASVDYPKQCSALRKGEFVMLKGHPCKIVDMSTSKTGKHGHAKVHLIGLDIITGKKYEDISPSTHNMTCPIVTRKEYPLTDTDGSFVSLMMDNGEIREDLKCDEDIMKEIKEKYKEKDDASLMVTVLTVAGVEKVISVKESKE